MHHFVTEMCTHVHSLLQHGALWEGTSALWDLRNIYIFTLPPNPTVINHLEYNYDVIKWKHYPLYWPFVRESTGGFPSHRPVTRSFEVFFHLRLKKRLSKQSRRPWFETTSRSLWRHCNVEKIHGCRCCLMSRYSGIEDNFTQAHK